jgi:predicted phosphodiesterase
LSADDREFVRKFQPLVEIPLAGENTLLAFHGSPNSNRDVILSTTPDSELAIMLWGHQATVMSGGHTHTPMLRRYVDTLVMNPGSIGLPFHPRPGLNKENDVRPPWAEYAILTDAPEVSVEFRRVPFDLELLLKTARKSEMPYFERWAAPWQGE